MSAANDDSWREHREQIRHALDALAATALGDNAEPVRRWIVWADAGFGTLRVTGDVEDAPLSESLDAEFRDDLAESVRDMYEFVLQQEARA